MDVVREIEHLETAGDRPLKLAVIANCGQLKKGENDGVVADPEDPYPTYPEDYLPDEQVELKVEQRLDIAAKLRGVGNNRFKAQKFEEAVAKYDKVRLSHDNHRPQI